jgi:TP901 family phage tail tape measure protein
MSTRELVFDIFAVDRASRVFSKVGAEMEATGAKSETVGKRFEKGMGTASTVAIGLGVASVVMASKFESATTRLITTAGESPKAMKLVSDGMLDMAGKVGYTSDQLAKGMYIVESAGIHGAKALDVLKASAQGAKTENAELGTVTDAVTTIMRDFGTKAGDAANITSTLIGAVSVGKTNFEDLSGSMSAVMPRAATLHLGFAEIAADLASMTAHGMSAQQSAENMNDALKHLAGPTLAQAKAMSDFGVQAHDVSQGLGKRGLAGTMQMLSDAVMSKMGPAGAQLKTVFNQSSLAAQDATKMMGGMSPKLQALAKDYVAGKTTVADWRKELKGLDTPSASLLKQWAAQQDASKGFSATLKSGGDSAKTYSTALQAMTGDQASMTVAMMLSGENSKFVNTNIKTVAASTKEADGSVKGFAIQQATLNGKLDDTKGALTSLSIKIGNDLLPVAKDMIDQTVKFVGVLERHKTAVEVVIGALVAYKVATIAIKVAQVIWATTTAVLLAAKEAQLGFAAASYGAAGATYATTAAGKAGAIVGALMNSTVWTGVAAWAASTTAQVANAEGGILAKAAIIGTSVATGAATAAQWLWNVALDANPIGLVIIVIVAIVAAIAAMVVGVIYAYKHCEKFRDIVNVGFGLMKIYVEAFALAAVTAFGYVLNAFLDFVSVLIRGAASAFGWVPGLGPKLKTAAKAVDTFKTDANTALNKVKNNLAVNIKTDAAKVQLDALKLYASKPISVAILYKPGAAPSPLAPPAHATGTSYAPGGMSLVGERGPEFVNIPRGSQVITADRTAGMLGKQGAALHIEHYHAGSAGPQEVAQAFMWELAR